MASETPDLQVNVNRKMIKYLIGLIIGTGVWNVGGGARDILTRPEELTEIEQRLDKIDSINSIVIENFEREGDIPQILEEMKAEDESNHRLFLESKIFNELNVCFSLRRQAVRDSTVTDPEDCEGIFAAAMRELR